MRFVLAFPLALLLLSGCVQFAGFDGPRENEHPPCSDSVPVVVVWHDATLPARLADAEAPGWNVTSRAPYAGLPTTDPRVASWNATVVHVGHHPMTSDVSTSLHVDGRLYASMTGPHPERARPAVEALLAAATTADEETRAQWYEWLLPNGTIPSAYPRDDPETAYWRYKAVLPVDAFDADGVLARLELDADEPKDWGEGDHDQWSARFSFHETHAVNGTNHVWASGSANKFEADWAPGTSDRRAEADVEAALAALGVGPARGELYVTRTACLE